MIEVENQLSAQNREDVARNRMKINTAPGTTQNAIQRANLLNNVKNNTD